MDAEVSRPNHLWGIFNGLLPTVIPTLLISIGYIDPGKWAAFIDGGARFGGDLVAFVLVFNLMAILCQYLSAHIGVVSGRNLAQICCDEYDKNTSIFLGVQAELSIVLLDLTMVLGIAQGLNMIFRVDLFSSVLLTALEAVLFPLFSTLLVNSTVKFLVICTAGLIFLWYVLGMLIIHPEFSVPPNSLLLKFSGERAFALMSLLGASIMPHNFYLHSSIVQRYQGPCGVSKGSWSYDNFFAIVTIFGGIFLVNYVLMNSAANIFNSTDIGLLTFHDAMSLMDQAFRSPIGAFAFFVVMSLANHISVLSWKFGEEDGRTILHEFFGVFLPGWLHCVTVRILAIIPALYCLWQSGAEGMYQMLIFTQVVMALLLPSSVIPLFRVASSRPIMGVHKMSPAVEFVALMTLFGMIGLKIIFVVEMIFGDSDWVGNLRWTMVNNVFCALHFLLVMACISLCFMLWLAATPLKSASGRLDCQPWYLDVQRDVTESFTEGEGNDVIETAYYEEEPIQQQDAVPTFEESLGSHSNIPVPECELHLPETILDTDKEPYLAAIEEKCAVEMSTSSKQCHLEQSTSQVESVPLSNELDGTSAVHSLSVSTLKIEETDLVEKTLGVEGDSTIEKDHEEGDSWEHEGSSKGETGVGHPVMSEGLGSSRSLSGKSDEGGNGAGSLSRLSGLGRAARRQLAAALDEFWGQLYDFHGQITKEAKAKKLDLLLGVDSKAFQSLVKADSGGKFQSVESSMSSSLYDSPNQQRLQSGMESAYGVQRGSPSLWSHHSQLLDAFVQGPSINAAIAGERRYSSLRIPPISDGLDYQPVTVPGYQLASYAGRIAKSRLDYMKDQLDSAPQKPPTLGPTNYEDPRSFTVRQMPTAGFTSMQPPGFQNRAVSRTNPMNSDKSYYDLFSPEPAAHMRNENNTKKYHSLPDISGLSLPLRNLYSSDTSSIWATSTPPMTFGSAVGRRTCEQSLYPSIGPSERVPLTIDEHSPSSSIRHALESRLNLGSSTNSLWSKQPFEQFGVANKISCVGTEGAGDGTKLASEEPTSMADVERKLLQSMRHCILKLLKLEGSDWLFRQNDGLDEELIDHVAARERFVYEAESRDMKQGTHIADSQHLISDGKSGLAVKVDEAGPEGNLVTSVPQCGETCVWKVDIIVSFAVFCIHRILELSLMESRPELWGKYTYVLNRLQGAIDLAFFKPRIPTAPCFCLQIPAAYRQRSSPPISNGMPPPLMRPVRGSLGHCSGITLQIIAAVIEEDWHGLRE
ncbi:hypothetical protein Nepgr_011649 [Nepenthes gracilis]|uniref:Ethylene-insensitive protein 2 n=1 Tax=Nepenthes gracilis TaxID=150966 RepID=A0AAD3XM47_NEPGR|nr:hypothetical protein Nepgr_011649 [Nepenthes gracilis]